MTDQDEKISWLADDFNGEPVESAINQEISNIKLQYRMPNVYLLNCIENSGSTRDLLKQTHVVGFDRSY